MMEEALKLTANRLAARNARRAIASASRVSSSEDASASATRPTARPALLSPAGAHSSARAHTARARLHARTCFHVR